jgi:putative membrane protein
MVTLRSRFTADEHRRIDSTIARIERNTTADLDIVVIRASDHYSLYPVVWAGFGALLIGGLVALFRPELKGLKVILIELIILIALTPLFDWLPIRLWLVPTRVKHARARQLAHREFDAHFTNAFSRKRILLFVSLGEHYVEVIADHDTHALVPDDAWIKIVNDLMTALKVGHAVDGLLAAIESCGALLKSHHPRISDDPRGSETTGTTI